MDMNFPHAKLDATKAQVTTDFRALLSHAMASQIASPTLRAMKQQSENGSVPSLSKAEQLRERIQFFSGRRPHAPKGVFLPTDIWANRGCAKAEQIGKNQIYQTASTNSKDPCVSPSDTAIDYKA